MMKDTGTNNRQVWRKILRWFKIIVLIYVIAGIALYYFQEKFLFHPLPLNAYYRFNFTAPFKEINIEISKNENLNLIQFFPKDSIRKGVVLYFHGNMQNINRYAKFAGIFTKNGYELWMMDYPGFGKTTGQLTERKLYQDASLIYMLAKNRFSKDSIIIFGKSLGTGVASQLASLKNCRRLILETPYYNIPDLFSYYAPIYPTAFMSRFKIPTADYLKEVSVPVTIFHGTKDEVIPYRSSVRLKNVLKPTDEFITIPGGSHNNLSDFEVFNKKIDSLLKK